MLRESMRLAHNRPGPGLLALVLLAWVMPAAAFNLDSDQPIRVTADKARLDDARGLAVYQGDVIVTQGETRLTADEVHLYRSEAGLERIDAEGNPATYHHPATAEQTETDARARFIRYFASENRLLFERNAEVIQGANEFRGALIEYDTVDRVVSGEGQTTRGEGSGRVEMVIQPRQDNDGNGSETSPE